MEIITILAIVSAVLFVVMTVLFWGAKSKHELAERVVDSHRDVQSRNLAELERTRAAKLILIESEHAALTSLVDLQQKHDVTIESAKGLARVGVELNSHNDALRELWRNAADRGRVRDAQAIVGQEYGALMAQGKDALRKKLHSERQRLGFERDKWQRGWQAEYDANARLTAGLAAYEQQQVVSDGNVQRLEAERDEAVQNFGYLKEAHVVLADALATMNTEHDDARRDLAGTRETLFEVGNISEARLELLRRAVATGEKAHADWLTQMRHNDTLNTVQARLMAERTAAQGERDGWEQTAGELAFEVKRMETELMVKGNAIKRLDQQLMKARANDTTRDPKTGRFAKPSKK